MLKQLWEKHKSAFVAELIFNDGKLYGISFPLKKSILVTLNYAFFFATKKNYMVHILAGAGKDYCVILHHRCLPESYRLPHDHRCQ